MSEEQKFNPDELIAKVNKSKQTNINEFGKFFKAGELAPTAVAFLAVDNLDEERNADEALRRLEAIISTVIGAEKIETLIDEVSKKIKDSLSSEGDEKRKNGLKKLQRLFLDRYAL